LLNAYGPTECNVDVSHHHLQQAPEGLTTPIGKAIPNVQLYVLDARLEPVPTGVKGDIYAGGIGVGRGYLQDPLRTAAVFVPDLFSSLPGARMYRTGDVGRFLADGALEYLQRSDLQVKIRGFRIELGEIEATLSKHPGIQQTVVVVHSPSPNEKQLVAYFVSRSLGPSVSDLRSFLKERLPDYMVPAHFMPLQAFPTTTSGKVNRSALPPPAIAREDVDTARPRPELREGTEATLGRIWTSVLKVSEVHPDDNFFELGGDSILSIQVSSRARSEGLKVTPKQLFESATLRELAGMVTPSLATTPTALAHDLSLLPMQQWFMQGDGPLHHFNLSIAAKLQPGVDLKRMREAIGLLVSTHSSLRMRFERTAQGWKQQPVVISEVPWNEVSVRDSNERGLALEKAQGSLSPEEGRLLSAWVLDMPGGQKELFLAVHHLATDVLSWPVLIEDLESAYVGLERNTSGTSTSLRYAQSERGRGSERELVEPIPVQVGQWAAHLAAFPSSPAGAKARETWKKVLGEPVGPAPSGLAKGVQTSAAAVEVRSLQLPRSAIFEQPRQIRDLILRALADTLAEVTGHPRHRIDVETHGRADPADDDLDLSRTVGWLTSTFPIVLEAGRGTESSLEPSDATAFAALRASGALPEATDSWLVFNHLGRLSESPADEPSSLFNSPPRVELEHSVSKEYRRRHAIELTTVVRDNRLELTWVFGDEPASRRTVQALSEKLSTALIERLGKPQRPSTPLLNLPATELDALWSSLPDPANVEDIVPLALAQHGILVEVLSGEWPDVYTLDKRMTVLGPLDVDVLDRAWARVVARHSVLRTSFAWRRLSRPVQVVRRYVLTAVERVEGAEPPSPLKDDPGTFPLHRLRVVRHGPERHDVVLYVHHLLLDGWSVPLIVGELFETYAALRDGKAPTLPRSAPFSEVVAWQQKQDRERLRGFWQEHLSGRQAPTPLPLARVKAAHAGSPGELAVMLSPEQQRTVDAVVRKYRITQSTLVHAAWALLLSRYTGEEDVVFGSIVSGRSSLPLPEPENRAGLFINTLPLRIPVVTAGEPAAFLAEVQRRQSQVQDFEHTALTDILQWTMPGRRAFESVVAFESYPADLTNTQDAIGLEFRFEVGSQKVTFPLMVAVIPGDRLGFRFVFDSAHVAPEDVPLLAKHFVNALVGLSTPHGSLADISLADAPEIQRLLVDFRGPDRRFANQTLCLHELFERSAAEHPARPAVRFEGKTLTYGELNQRANALAHALKQRGVGPDVLVGLCLERSFELVISVIAVLKAGGAYVPVDPGYPADRLAYMVTDCGARVLITQKHLQSRLPAHSAEVLLVDASSPLGEVHPNPASGVRPDNLAYVIYTSGSTGRPKGAMNSHRGIVNRVLWQLDAFKHSPADVILHKTPFSFDISVWELWVPLACGGTLVVAKPDGHRDPEYLIRLIQDERITLAHFVPSMLQAFLEHPGSASCQGLRDVFCSGEALPHALQERFHAKLPATLHNLYGPTEAAVEVTYWRCERQSPRQTVPIGRPLANTSLYVLDAEQRPSPIGIPGELHIGGIAVGRGYWGRPELTQEKFVPDPFGSPHGTTLYKTGDLAVYLNDGTLEYLGRLDHQVKLRGHRIELGEIESALLRHPSVGEAVVVVKEGASGDKRLVAYVSLRQSLTQPAETLRPHLAQSLPDYMVPAAFMVLPALPLTPNGKIDRKALPEPSAQPVAPKNHVAPRDETEAFLTGLWQSLLHRPSVSIHDNFFELGGDSIVALRLLARVAEAGRSLQLKDVFAHPTIEALAKVTRAGKVLTEPVDETPGPVPLTPIQHWFFERAPKDPHHYNQAIRLVLRPTVKLDLLSRALHEAIGQHDVFQLKFFETDGGWRQERMADIELPPLEHFDWTGLAPEDQTRKLQDTMALLQASLVLERPPLFRMAVFEVGAHERTLLLIAHHLISDLVSWRLLLEDLTRTYGALETGSAVSEKERTRRGNFKSWAKGLVKAADEPKLLAELPHWKRTLSPSPAPLPLDTPGGDNTVEHQVSVIASLGFDPTQRLLAEVHPTLRARPMEMLLAALWKTLHAWTRQTRFVVALEGHGRVHPLGAPVDVTNTFGWFTSYAPLRLEAAAQTEGIPLLLGIKEALRQVPTEGQGLGFGILRYLSRSEQAQDLRQVPLPELSFNFFGQMENADPNSPLFLAAVDDTGPVWSPRQKRPHLIDINVAIADGVLQTQVMYSSALFRRETMEALAKGLMDNVQALLDAASKGDQRVYAASDFSLANLDQQGLDELLEELE
jgi:amino acid adenylation domain-containing protein/non-ribosomal peptide synthase protein (TIGR01720 family)